MTRRPRDAGLLFTRVLDTDPEANTLLAVIGDVAHPTWRARSIGVYRRWRDGGFALGALLSGLVADAYGLVAAIWVVAALTAASGVVVAVRMYETHRPANR